VEPERGLKPPPSPIPLIIPAPSQQTHRSMYQARIASPDEFRDNRDAWDRLASSMHFPTIFCTWEWIYTWWEHFGRQHELAVVFIHDGEELKGVLPLFAYRAVLKGGWLTGRVLSYAGTTEVYPDHLDVICAEHDAAACMEAVERLLSAGYRAWDVLQLPLITADSALAEWTRSRGFSFKAAIIQTSVAPYIPLTEDFEKYIGKLDKKTRYNIRSRRKKLYEQHQIKYLACTAGEEKAGLDALFALHELRARKKGIDSTFEGGKIRAFHDSLVERAGNKGWIALSLLKNASDTIAASYNFVFGNRVFSYQKGNHPGWGQFGPGSVILHDCIQDAYARGCVEYNLLQGNEAYKYDWTSQVRPLLTANVFNSTAGGRLSRAGFGLKQRLKRLIKPARKPDAVQN